jgi:hypothetical protein
MRSVCGPGRIFDEDRLVRLDLVHPVDVVDGVIGHRGDEVLTRLFFERIDLCRVAEQVWLPLVGVAAVRFVLRWRER